MESNSTDFVNNKLTTPCQLGYWLVLLRTPLLQRNALPVSIASPIVQTDEWIGVPPDVENWLGFVYLITAPSGRKYIGKKLFWSALRRAPLKGQKRVRRASVESDWMKYYGSSNELLKELRDHGQLLRRIDRR